MNLEESYNYYQEGLVSFKELKREVLEYSYSIASRDKYIEAGDFILIMIPKVEQIIMEFNPQLSKFINYLNRHIKWLILQCNKEYIKKRDKTEAFHYHEVAKYKENLVCKESTPVYRVTTDMESFLKLKKGEITSNSMRRRILILSLKNSRLLSDDLIEELSKLLGCTREWLIEKKEYLNRLGESRLKNREYLQERCNRLFIDITKDQEKILKCHTLEEKQEILLKLEEKRERLHRLQETLTNRSYGPKNEDIAKLLDIPKGTVDSSLFYIKKKLESFK